MKKLILNLRPVHARVCKRLGISIEDYAEQLKKNMTEELQGKSLEQILEENPDLEEEKE